MFFSKNVLTIEKNQRILPKLLVFPLKKYQERGGQSVKNPTIGGDLYDQGGSKNRGFHNGRNFWGHFLIQHPVRLYIVFFQNKEKICGSSQQMRLASSFSLEGTTFKYHT